MFRVAISISMLVALLVSCCTSKLKPPPKVTPAPRELTVLRIHVYNASSEAASKAEEDVAGYTVHLRGAVQRALVRAGYTVVINPGDPHDLVARINADWPWKKPGTATMVLEAPQGVVTQFSRLVRIDENADLDEQGAVDLVEAIASSPSVAVYARQKIRGGPLEIATPPQGSPVPETKRVNASLGRLPDQHLDFCDTFSIEYTGLYPILNVLPKAVDEGKMYTEVLLEEAGFKETDRGLGNWTDGPRVIHVQYEKGNCSCTLCKNYYYHEKLEDGFYNLRVTELIKCDVNNKEASCLPIPSKHEANLRKSQR